MNRCDHEKLLLLAAGELDYAQVAPVERHVAGCAACADELARLRDGLAALDRLPPLEPSGRAVEAIRATGRQALAQRIVRRTARPHILYRYRFAVAAAAMLAVVFGWSLLQPGRPTGATVAELDWNHADRQVSEGSNLAEDLAEFQQSDPWTHAANTLIADLGRADVNGELLEIDENLDLLEPTGGS